MRNGHHHVLAVDQVFLLDLALLVDDHRAARRGEFLPHGSQLVLDDGLDARARAQDLEIVGDLFRELVELGLDLVPAERGEALEPQVENGLGLLGGEPRGAGCGHLVARIVDQLDERRRRGGRPVAAHQRLTRLVGILRGADQPDHLVDIGHRDGKPDEDVGAVARLAEQIFGAPGNHFLAEGDEGREHVLEVHHQRAAAIERDHVRPEARLQRRVTVELVEHDLRHGVALDLDDDAIAIAVGFIA